MSKSNLNALFCLEGLLLDTMIVKEKTVDLFVRSPRLKAICPQCETSTKRVNRRTKRHVKHMLHDDKVVVLCLTVRDFRCVPCGTVFRESIPGVNRQRTSLHYRESMAIKVKDRSFSSVGREYNLSAGSVSRATNEAMERIGIMWSTEPFALGLDGHSFSGRDMATTVTDVTHRKLLTIIPDDRQTTVRRFLSEIPQEIKGNITSVCIDMDRGLYGAVKKEFRDMPVVIDKFHVIQHFNKHLCQIRLLYTTSSFPLPKQLFEKNKEDLTEEEQAKLKMIFKRYPPIAEFWRMKEIMRKIYKVKTHEKAYRRFSDLLNGLECDYRPRWQELYRTLKRWQTEILNYFIYRVTNAYTEGIHTRIKLLKRISYGFRNKTNYIAKMTMAFLPTAVLLQAVRSSSCLT